MQIEETKGYENHQYMGSIQAELDNIDNIKTKESKIVILGQGIKAIKQRIEIDTFIPVKVWPDSEVYEASEEVTYKSDDYITVDNIDTLNRALSMFNPKQKSEMIEQLLDIQGIDLEMNDGKGYAPTKESQYGNHFGTKLIEASN